MGADREPRLSASEYDASVVIAVQNPGDDTAAGNTPPPMLAMPVQSADERAAAAAAGAADEPVVLHVRCSGCGLVVQFPLVPDVRRHGIICSVCTTVSYPYVDGLIPPDSGANRLRAYREGAEGGGALWRLPGQAMPPAGSGGDVPRGEGAEGRAAEEGRGAGVYPLRAPADPADGAAHPDGQPPRAGPVEAQGAEGGAAERVAELAQQRPPAAGTSAGLHALARVTKWFSAIDIFIVVVESLLGTAAALLGPQWRYLGLIAAAPPLAGYLGAARYEPRLVAVYATYSVVMVGYNAFTTYLRPNIWRLLLLLLEVYMCRIVLRFYSWLIKVSPAERAAHIGGEQHRLRGMIGPRSALVPW